MKRLQDTIKWLGAAAQADAVAYAHDRNLHPEPGAHAANGLILWSDSDAARWLRVDMNAGLHL